MKAIKHELEAHSHGGGGGEEDEEERMMVVEASRIMEKGERMIYLWKIFVGDISRMSCDDNSTNWGRCGLSSHILWLLS